MSAAAIELPDASQSVAPAVTPGSAEAEADLRAYTQTLIDAWKALDRMEAEGLPVVATRLKLRKRFEFNLTVALGGVLDGWDDESVAAGGNGPDNTSVAAHAPAPASEGGSDE